MTFDFSAYRGWARSGYKILRADSELILWHEAGGRYYRVAKPARKFVLYFQNEGEKDYCLISQRETFQQILADLGTVRALPQRQTQLQLPGTNLGVIRKR